MADSDNSDRLGMFNKRYGFRGGGGGGGGVGWKCHLSPAYFEHYTSSRA